MSEFQDPKDGQTVNPSSDGDRFPAHAKTRASRQPVHAPADQAPPSGIPKGRAEDAPDPSDEPVALPLEDAIDLHPFRPAEIPAVVESYLDAAVEAGFAEVRIIHGRGVGVQRERVRAVLSRHPDVVNFKDAPAPRGGWGATVAVLKTHR
ncbi:MAG: Smr/MutS family protein [Acidobacteriota bacterium]